MVNLVIQREFLFTVIKLTLNANRSSFFLISFLTSELLKMRLRCDLPRIFRSDACT